MIFLWTSNVKVLTVTIIPWLYLLSAKVALMLLEERFFRNWMLRFDDNIFYMQFKQHFNPLSVNLTKWSNTPKQFVSVCEHFRRLVLKGLTQLKVGYWAIKNKCQVTTDVINRCHCRQTQSVYFHLSFPW